MRETRTGAAAPIASALPTAAPATAAAAAGPTDLVAGYVSDGAYGYWYDNFLGTITVADNGMCHVSGYLEVKCLESVLGGFGCFRFRDKSAGSAWTTFDVACSSKGRTSTTIETAGVREPSDGRGITGCVGGLLVYTQNGGEESVQLSEYAKH